MEEQKYVLYNTNNYLKNLSMNNYNEYLSKYVDIINEFLIHSSTSFEVKDKNYYIFLHERGLDTLKHIFKQLLYYTKNIDLTTYHCKKAYLYYVEFISQIGDDTHSYLQLNSKDATLFVYKKTIYDINNSYKQKCFVTDKEKKIFELMNNVINIYEKLIITSMKKNIDIIENKQTFLTIEKDCLKIINKFFIEKLVFKSYIDNCTKFLQFMDFLTIHNDTNYNKFISLCNLFLKKLIEKKKNVKKINIIMSTIESEKNLKNFTSAKYINWLFNFH